MFCWRPRKHIEYAAECVTVKYYTYLTIVAKKNFSIYSGLIKQKYFLLKKLNEETKYQGIVIYFRSTTVLKDHVLILHRNLKNLITNYSQTSKAELKTLKEGMATSKYRKAIVNIKEIREATRKSANQLSVMQY
jgi:hypothetical protein